MLILFLASFLVWFLVGGLFVLWIIDGKIKKEIVAHAIFATVSAWIVSQMVKSIYPTSRPFEINGGDHLTLTKPLDSSFPSSHAAIAFALAVTIWLHDKRWGIVYLVSALAIGAARIVGNVHYPLDVFGGAVIGVAISLLTDRVHFFQLLARRKKRT